ncbi:MAG TPA: ATP-dependent metallopeptidase FtsH/Yme1/Tma family protein, partial [Bryobacteraceae bacterium]|nr:ATP-dependent metallopeptidase FtsH/Yme1/Tma family protein [Bryobacteraceae bacterium]
MNSNVKTAVLWIVLICVAVLLWIVVRTGRTGGEQELAFSDFLNYVEQGRVKKVTVSGTDIKGEFTDGTRLHAV